MDKKIYKEIQEQIKKAIEPLEEREIIFVICNKLLYALKHKNLEGCNKNCVAPALIDIANLFTYQQKCTNKQSK